LVSFTVLLQFSGFRERERERERERDEAFSRERNTSKGVRSRFFLRFIETS